MILGSGIDVIQVARLEKELHGNPWREGEGIFTVREIHLCTRQRHPARCYAALFAAKEAALKALGVGATSLASLEQVEIMALRGGQHVVRFHDPLRTLVRRSGIRRALVSLCMTRRLSSAMVVLED